MVSIVITAYNVAEYIEQSVRSALEQTHEDIEVIVVIDKPTDGTEAIVRGIATTDARVRVIENSENVGAGLSRRAGIQAANGEYILLLDGDDFLRPTFIADLYSKAEETGADIVSGGIEILHEDGVRDITLYGERITEGYDKVTKFWGERIVFMNNKLIRRTLHDKVPYCHRRYIEDTPVIIPQLWYANKVAYVDNAGYVYRMQPNSLTHTTTPVKDVIFKGLCWCDIYEFFEKNDNNFFDVLDVKGYIARLFDSLATLEMSEESISPYLEDWAELTRRLFRACAVTRVNFRDNIKKTK